MSRSAPDQQEQIARRLRLRDLHVLAVVARAGGMGRAAVELGVSQPAVSQAVADLEAAVGVALLERNPWGVATTPAGAALLRRGAEAFDALGQGLRDAAVAADPGAGEVRVGASESYIAAGFLAAAIDRVARRHPRMSVEVAEANAAGLDFGGLRDRSLDVVLGRTGGAGLPDDLRCEVLYDEPILVLAGAGGRWAARGAAVTLEELAAAPWVLAPPGTAVHALVADAFRAAGLAPPRAAATTYSMQLRMQLLARGDYVSSLPASLLRENGRRWGLVALPVSLGRPLPVAAVTLRHRPADPVVRLFLDHLRAATAEALAGEALAGEALAGEARPPAGRPGPRPRRADDHPGADGGRPPPGRPDPDPVVVDGP